MTGHTQPEHDFAAVVEEIEAEARRLRESGEFPPSLERELDALFEDLVPERLNEHDFEAVLERAERASLIDLHAPIEDERRAYSQVKRVVQKLVLWYMEYVVRQLSTFAANTTRAVRLLGNRVERVEQEHEALARRLPGLLDDLDADLAALVPPLPDEAVAAASEALSGVAGRVAHAEAGSGAVVERLRSAGIDAYGVDPSAETDTESVRRGAALHHLALVGEGALAGVVLSGAVDRAPTGAKIALLQAAASALAPGGRLALLAHDPDAYAGRVPAALTELAPSVPLSREAWRFLVERAGFGDVEISGAGPGVSLVTARKQ